jgi:elongation factor Ts
VKLIAELRKRTEVSLSKAREALKATDNNLDAALEWLHKDIAISGAHQAAKVQERPAKDGLIAVSILSGGLGRDYGSKGIRAAMVELNCETDFVSRNQNFAQLASDIAYTAAFMHEPQESEALIRPCSLDMLHNAPLLPEPSVSTAKSSSEDTSHLDRLYPSQNTSTSQMRTVQTAIFDLGYIVRERISLRRAVTVVLDPLPPSQPPGGFRVASYLHGDSKRPLQGRLGSLVLLGLKSPQLNHLISVESFCKDLVKLEQALARQITGFETRSVRSPDTVDETALYNQPFMMFSRGPDSMSVSDVLKEWAQERQMASHDHIDGSQVEVLEFSKWTVGENL